jgi:hypothetical protein
MSKPILNALKNPGIARFIPYMLDDALQVENKFPGTELINIDTAGYNLNAFAEDNKLVMTWFSQLQLEFNQWLQEQGLTPANLVATGSRSFNTSYTESDLECAVVSENFDDFLAFCRFLNNKYENGHNFIAIKTLAGLPLLIIKSEAGFCCPDLAKIYPGKTLPQLEVTFRHPSVHAIIQQAGIDFFTGLNPDEFASYVNNKRYIELLSRQAPKDLMFEGKTIKATLEEFKGALAAALKCLPPGELQAVPAFNKEVFANAVKPKSILTDAVVSGLAFYQPAPATENTSQFGMQAKMPL